MKYIRTKDEIIEVNPKLTNKEINIVFGKDTKRANAIEELCDEFVIDNPDSWSRKPFVTVSNFYELLDEKSRQFQKEHNIKIYGAIWTEKGLIYVAKMNENGELELL